MMETRYTNQTKFFVDMFNEFITTDAKLLLTWAGSMVMVLLNLQSLEEYELWKVIALDALTALSLIVAIGYTIARWVNLWRKNKDKLKK